MIQPDLIAIVGESGSGKTRSIVGLDPASTFMITMSGKKPSFIGWKSKYTPLDLSTAKGNFFHATSYSRLVPDLVNKTPGLLKTLSSNPAFAHVKNIVIDDFQYLMSFEFMERAYEKGWDKFTEMARHCFDVIKTATELRPDLKIFFLAHEEQVKAGNIIIKRKIKTIGNLLDDKITLEGLFTFVLFTATQKEVGKEQPDYYFMTQTDGVTTAKTPEGAFDSFLIPNDLGLVAQAVDKYNNG